MLLRARGSLPYLSFASERENISGWKEYDKWNIPTRKEEKNQKKYTAVKQRKPIAMPRGRGLRKMKSFLSNFMVVHDFGIPYIMIESEM
jgi:hypothetical protein